MGLADDIHKQQMSNLENEQLAQRWKESGFTTRDPKVERPSDELATLIAEALPMLKFREICYRAPAPDGTIRVTGYISVKPTGLAKLFSDTAKSVTNAQAAKIPVSPQGKDSPNVNLLIFPDGLVAWVGSSLGSPYTTDVQKFGGFENVKSHLVSYLAKQK